MASFIMTTLLAAGIAIGDQPVDPRVEPPVEITQGYGGCARAAEQAVAMTGGEVLSVVPAPNGKPFCRVTVLVTNAKGRPKRIRVRIPMDF